MSEDKETLRKEFAEVLRSGITFAGQIGDYVINESVFGFLETNLKNQAEEYVTVIKGKDNLLVGAHKRIEQLKAELSRKEEMLKAADDIIASLTNNLNYTYGSDVQKLIETYKTLKHD